LRAVVVVRALIVGVALRVLVDVRDAVFFVESPRAVTDVGIKTLVRAWDVVRLDFTVVEMRCCVGAVSDFARVAALPSRTAAPAPLIQDSKKAQKIRIFFISGKILAKLRISGQEKYMFCLM